MTEPFYTPPPVPDFLRINFNDTERQQRWRVYIHVLKLFVPPSQSQDVWLRSRDIDDIKIDGQIIVRQEVLRHIQYLCAQGILQKTGHTSNAAYRMIPAFIPLTTEIIKQTNK